MVFNEDTEYDLNGLVITKVEDDGFFWKTIEVTYKGSVETFILIEHQDAMLVTNEYQKEIAEIRYYFR